MKNNKGWRKITQKEFVKLANDIHDFKYEYSNCIFEYHNNNNIKIGKKINIKCKEHDEVFSQIIKNHLKGQIGCKCCKTENQKRINAKNKPTIDEFIKKANVVHNFKYDYSDSKYVDSSTKIKIRCIEHDEIFFQISNSHLRGYAGCHECANKKYKTTCLNNHGVENPLQSEKVKEKRKQTCLEKYGVEHSLQSEKVKEKRKQTCLEKYGVEHISQTAEFKEQFKKTMQERYGCDYAMQSDELKERCKKSLQDNHGVNHPSQSKECYTNRNKAMAEKYGAEHAMQAKELKERHRETLQSNYGVDVPLKSETIHNRFKTTMKERYGKEYTAEVDWLFEQMKQTNLERYGFEYPIQNEEIQKKMKQTNLERYGAEYPIQNEKIREKIRVKMEKEGKWIPKDLLTEVQLYYKQVITYTNKQPSHSLENYTKRGLAGIEDAYHIDHKVSIKYGFENSIPPYIIGDINNLEMLPWFDNIYKSSNCSIDIDELFTLMEL